MTTAGQQRTIKVPIEEWSLAQQIWSKTASQFIYTQNCVQRKHRTSAYTQREWACYLYNKLRTNKSVEIWCGSQEIHIPGKVNPYQCEWDFISIVFYFYTSDETLLRRVVRPLYNCLYRKRYKFKYVQ